MTDLRQAAQQALEALEEHEGNYKLGKSGCERQEKAITAIKKALAQPPLPVQEPVAWMSADRAWMWSDYIKAIAAVANIPTLTLIPLYTAPPAAQPEQHKAEPCIGKDPRCPCQDGDACHYKDCKATKAWPVPQAAPVGEVVEVNNDGFKCEFSQRLAVGTKLYTTPPQRPWVGLTEEEMSDIVADIDVDFGDLLWKVVCLTKIIEAKLKERNK
jgi:hypothetical protein